MVNHPNRSKRAAPAWPKHPDGRPMKMGEMTDAQQVEQTAAAIERLKPEFARLGVAVNFGGVLKPGDLPPGVVPPKAERH